MKHRKVKGRCVQCGRRDNNPCPGLIGGLANEEAYKRKGSKKDSEMGMFFQYAQEFERLLDLKTTLKRIEAKLDKILERDKGNMTLKEEQETLQSLKDVAKMEGGSKEAS